MLKMDIIKFEAQDVITSSIPCYCTKPDCRVDYEYDGGRPIPVGIIHTGHDGKVCSDCIFLQKEGE